ncbi:MAG: hypothetical protein HY512_00895 [Candidatus Aenigmarchaeota archaeon]|nr:hypothetical protein [Candidatus Aenigmarchaeota archaeon]
MDQLNILTGLIAVVIVIVAIQTVQLVTMSQKAATGNFVATNTQAQVGSQSQSGAIDTSGMTADEKMNYEMHGIVPARYGSSGSSALNGLPQQVGGC